jgi:hypothetical protein
MAPHQIASLKIPDDHTDCRITPLDMNYYPETSPMSAPAVHAHRYSPFPALSPYDIREPLSDADLISKVQANGLPKYAMPLPPPPLQPHPPLQPQKQSYIEVEVPEKQEAALKPWRKQYIILLFVIALLVVGGAVGGAVGGVLASERRRNNESRES